MVTYPLTKTRNALAWLGDCAFIGAARKQLRINAAIKSSVGLILNLSCNANSQQELQTLKATTGFTLREIATIMINMYPPKMFPQQIINPKNAEWALFKALELLDQATEGTPFVECAYKVIITDHQLCEIDLADYLWQSLGFPKAACMEALSHTARPEYAIRSGSLSKERLTELTLDSDQNVRSLAKTTLRTFHPTFQFV